MSLVQQQNDFQSALAEWYATAQRPLPWRKKPSVYRTVVSELMAQQTQIKTMLPYFERWMQRFPDFNALAEAPEETVMKHWEGLGYYSRARNLHKLAKEYVAADPKPRTREEWQALPGIGPYTSAAIASIAYGQPAAVVDGNVVRILARLTYDTRSFKNNGEAVKAFGPLAQEVLDHENPGDHNQAMMELGATVCLKRKPLCTLCPVAAFCRGRTSEELDDLPRIQRKATVHRQVDRAWILEEGSLLLHRIPDSAGQLAGQYELPELGKLTSGKPKAEPLLTRTRSITHHRIREDIHHIAPPPQIPPEHRWIALAEIEKITLSGPHRRWVKELLSRFDKS